eukprot:1376869-Pleurochrysis_carterae.AAC.6
MTPKNLDCPLSLEKGVAESISSSVLTVLFPLRSDIVGVFGAVAFVALGDDIELRAEAEDVAVFIGAEQKRLIELVGLELEALKTLVLELGSTRRRRAGAATVATELDEEANIVNAVIWTACYGMA